MTTLLFGLGGVMYKEATAMGYCFIFPKNDVEANEIPSRYQPLSYKNEKPNFLFYKNDVGPASDKFEK